MNVQNSNNGYWEGSGPLIPNPNTTDKIQKSRHINLKDILMPIANSIQCIMHKSNITNDRNRKTVMQKSAIYLMICLLLLSLPACKKENENVPDCASVAPTGHLTYKDASGPYTFRTNSGGTIVIDVDLSIAITHDDYPGFKIALWGGSLTKGVMKLSAQYESLNGKHIKNRLGSRRSIIFPDGAKITMVAEGEEGPLISISIYDGTESHHINPGCKNLVISSTLLATAQQLDSAEADGETGKFEISPTGLLWTNLYTEDVPGNKVTDYYKLGELFWSTQQLITDYYDDPRVEHT